MLVSSLQNPLSCSLSNPLKRYSFGSLLRNLFLAPDSNGIMQAQVKGISTPTIDITTDHLAKDHEGWWRRFAAGTVPYRDGRVVENLFTNPEAPATQTVSLEIGQTYLLQSWGTYSITVTGTATGTLSGAAERKVLKLTATADGNATFTVNTAPDKFMLENSTGRADVDTPSEFVADQTTFCYENGITVLASVVTEPASYSAEVFPGYNVNVKGALLNPLPSFAYSPGGVNLVDDSDLSGWALTGVTRVQDRTSLEGVNNSKYYIVDSSTSVLGYASSIAFTPNIGTVKAWVEKDVVATHCCQVNIKNGVTTVQRVQLALATGEYHDRDPAGNNGISVIDAGIWWILLIEMATVIDRLQFYAAINSVIPPDGSTSVNSTGSTGSIQIEFHVDKTIDEVKDLEPIITDGSPVTITEIVVTPDSTNHNDDSGLWFFAVTPNGDTDILDGFAEYLSPNYILGDGTNSVTKAGTVSTLSKVAIVYSSRLNLMNLTVNGSASADTTYDGTLLQGVLDVFRGGIYASRINNLARISGGSYDQLKARALELTT